MKIKSTVPPTNKALVYIYRNQAVLGASSPMTIVFNDKYSYFVGNKKFTAVFLEPGEHKITSYISSGVTLAMAVNAPGNLTGSKTSVAVNVIGGQKYYLQLDEVGYGDTGLSTVPIELAEKRLLNCRYFSISGKGDDILTLGGGNNPSGNNGTNLANNKKSQPIKVNFDLPKGSKINSNAIAVVIGNKNYAKNNADIPDVDFALNDASFVKRYLIETLGYREGNIIFLEDAGQSQFLSTFGSRENPKGTLFNYIRPGLSDVFVFYSGHGSPSLQNGKGYLLPVDANPSTVDLNGYPLETLYENLSKIPARSMTIVIDACFSGSSAGGSLVKNASSISLRRVESSALIKNAVIFSAAGTDQVASWDRESNLGLFTRYFFEGISGAADKENFGDKNGQVTASELKKFLESEVSYMARRLYLRDQNPQMNGNGAMVLSTLN